MSSVYQQRGYENRRDYLQQLAEDHGVDVMDVYALADMLGESEDFDGLINAIEDIQ